MARWGMPGPPQYGGARSPIFVMLDSPHWRGWLGRHNRCVVPATSFCEYADTRPRKTPKWFALSEAALCLPSLLWASWRGVRGPKSASCGQHELFGFLTTEANAVVAPDPSQGHAGRPDDAGGGGLWLLADALKGLELQRPLRQKFKRTGAPEQIMPRGSRRSTSFKAPKSGNPRGRPRKWAQILQDEFTCHETQGVWVPHSMTDSSLALWTLTSIQ